MNNRKAAMVFGVGLAVAVGLANAQGMMSGKPMMGNMPGDCMMMEAGHPEMQEMQQLKARMQAAMAQPQADLQEVLAMHDRMAALHRLQLVDCLSRRAAAPLEAPAEVEADEDDHAAHH